MSAVRVESGVPDPRSVLHPHLPGACFAHASRVATVRGNRTALQAYRDLAASVPGWFDGLMALRNRGMRLLGMKDLGSLRDVATATPIAPGERLGIFTLQAMSDDAIVLADADRHLRVQLAVQWHEDVLEVATVVHIHNAFGHLYMAPVAPVHRMIVPLLLRRQVRAYA